MTKQEFSNLNEKVNTMAESQGVDSAISYLDRLIDEQESADALYLRGRLNWKLGRKGEAISDYSAAVALDPHSPAAAALDMARQVMDFFNPDLYNP